MIWNVSFVLMCLCMAVAILVAIILSVKRKAKGFLKPFNIVMLGVFFAVLMGVFPTNYVELQGTTCCLGTILEAVALSLVNVLQVFSVDMDGKELLSAIREQSFVLNKPYVFVISVLSAIAPLMTVGVIISVIAKFNAHVKYALGYCKPAYIFSELNERSLTLATDIKNNHKKAMIIFTDVLEKEEELFFDLSNKAKMINAILFKNDVLGVKFTFHKKTSEISFFIMGEDETENIDHTLSLIERYRERENTRLYIFSSNCESELALSGINKGKLKVRRINEVQSLVYRTLYESGTQIFEKAIEHEDGTKHIDAIVIGMGNYGTEMLKALAWYCQMDGYKITIDAFDLKESAESEFKALCPDLMSPKYNGVYQKGESEYTIRVHSGMNANSDEILTIFKNLGAATYVFVSVGSDAENINIAVNMRKEWGRLGFNPTIQAVVKNPKISQFIDGAVNSKKEPYNLECVGDNKIAYSENVVIDSELELAGLERHLVWGPYEDSFWEVEYNYRSSIAAAIHKKAKILCQIKNVDRVNQLYKEEKRKYDEIEEERKATGDTSERRSFSDTFKEVVIRELGNERIPLQMLEHRRWNAYMRGEGYIYGKMRNHIFKTHPDLVNYYSLSKKEQEKDIW